MTILAAALTALSSQNGICQSTVKIVPEEISESGIFNRYVVTADDTQFSVIQPAGWGVSHSPEGKSLSFRSPRNGMSFKAQWKAASEFPPESRKDPIGWLISNQFEQATLSDKQVAHGQGIDGTAFNVRHVVGERHRFASRAGFFALNGGYLVATLTVPEASAKEIDAAWVGLVNSLDLKVAPKAAGAK